MREDDRPTTDRPGSSDPCDCIPGTVPPKQFGLAELGQVFGLLAGVTTLVYVSGAAVLWLRLATKHLPSEAVISNLPRQLMISIGLTEVVLPLLVAGSIATTVLFVIVKLTPIESVANALDDWAHATRAERALLGAAVGASLVGGEVAVWQVAGLRLTTVLLVVATACVFWGAGRAIRLHFRRRLESFAAVLCTAALVVACFTPWLVAAAQRRHPLLQATLCLTDAPPITGSLISETGNRVYIGASAGELRRPGTAQKPGSSSRPAIAVLPRTRVQELLIGGSFECAQAATTAKPPIGVAAH